MEECPHCSGYGRVPYDGLNMKECVVCEGGGYLVNGQPPQEEE